MLGRQVDFSKIVQNICRHRPTLVDSGQHGPASVEVGRIGAKSGPSGAGIGPNPSKSGTNSATCETWGWTRCGDQIQAMLTNFGATTRELRQICPKIRQTGAMSTDIGPTSADSGDFVATRASACKSEAGGCATAARNAQEGRPRATRPRQRQGRAWAAPATSWRRSTEDDGPGRAPNAQRSDAVLRLFAASG